MTVPARHFDAAYAERATLRDGTTVVLRLVTPDDKALLRDGFERWSPESRYARFLAPKQSLSDDELRYLTELDQETHFALGAVREDGAGVGVARFIQLAEAPDTAEAAIAVADEAHGLGLGKLLFLRLVAAARERGIAKFRCELLGSNTSMKHLIDAIAPASNVAASGGLMSIDFALPAIAPTAPASEPAPRDPMYELFRRAAENTVDWTEAIRRLWRLK